MVLPGFIESLEQVEKSPCLFEVLNILEDDKDLLKLLKVLS